MAHTTKHKVTAHYTEELNVKVYTSGGVLHTVEVQNIVTGEAPEYKSFTGDKARDRAMSYAKKIATS